jgi:hypothetical protein
MTSSAASDSARTPRGEVDDLRDVVALFPSHRAAFNSHRDAFAYLSDSTLVREISAMRGCGESAARKLLRAAVERVGGHWGQDTRTGGLAAGRPSTHVFETYRVPWSAVE